MIRITSASPWAMILAAVLAVAVLGCPSTPPDTTPPGPVTGFSATAGDAQVLLAWTNPADADLAGVKIVRKTLTAPASPTDGTEVYNGTGTMHTDATAANGTQYFYAAFAYDAAGNYSTAAQATATPSSESAAAEILQSLADLESAVTAVPAGSLTPAQQAVLEASLNRAELLYRGNDPCGAASEIRGEFLMRAQEYRTGEATPVAEELYNAARMLSSGLLGAELLKAACPGSERVGLVADAAVDAESAADVTGGGTFGEPILLTVVQEDAGKATRKVFTQVHIPGAEANLGAAGLPAVPVFRRLIAVPRGGQAILMAEKQSAEIAETIKMNLYPTQEQPVDAAPDPSIFENKPFVQNADRYASDAPYPPDPVTLIPLGDARDMNVYLLEVAAGQYRPRSNAFDLFKNVHFAVDFQGGSGAFITEAMLNPFESNSAVLTEAVLNRASVSRYIEGRFRPVLSGEELLILTHPNFHDAAIALRDWKRAKGIHANVFDCGTGSGVTGRQTNAEIDTFIQDRYDSVFIRPSYILLLGDAEYIPCFYQSGIGTDWPYAILGAVGVDTIPDFAVGRIPVDTLDQATTVVNKIIQYEQNPPNNAAFYRNASIASQFQCCRSGAASGTDQRTFIEVSEFGRNVMVSAGKTVERIYTETGGPTVPRRYYDGTLLPTAIGGSSGFAWDGDAADITAAWNAGRFLIMHRDHGWQEGWSHPEYELPDVDDLTNGELQPVVFSVNCASGFWDNETAGGAYGTTFGGIYFTEKLLRKADGGAVGILGDTRNSPSWANSTLTQGFFDAIWPSAIGSFGGAASQRRLGDILNHGKLYLMSQVGFSVMGEVIENADAIEELYLWHCIGDPTLEIWTRNPHLLILRPELIYRYIGLVHLNEVPFANGVNLEYAQNGAMITIFALGPRETLEPIGRGPVINGVANINFLEQQRTNTPLTFIANYENAVAKPLTAQKAQ